MIVQLQKPFVVTKTCEYFAPGPDGTFIPDEYRDILPTTAEIISGGESGGPDSPVPTATFTNVDLLREQGKDPSGAPRPARV